MKIYEMGQKEGRGKGDHGSGRGEVVGEGSLKTGDLQLGFLTHITKIMVWFVFFKLIYSHFIDFY